MLRGWAKIYADDGSEVKDLKSGEHCRNHIFGEVLEVPFGDSDFLTLELHTQHEGSHMISEFVILEDGKSLDSGKNNLPIPRERKKLGRLEDRQIDKQSEKQDGRGDRLIDRQTDRQTAGRRDKHTDRQTDRQTVRKTDGRRDRQTDRQTHKQSDKQDGRGDRLIDGQTNSRANSRTER